MMETGGGLSPEFPKASLVLVALILFVSSRTSSLHHKATHKFFQHPERSQKHSKFLPSFHLMHHKPHTQQLRTGQTQPLAFRKLQPQKGEQSVLFLLIWKLV